MLWLASKLASLGQGQLASPDSHAQVGKRREGGSGGGRKGGREEGRERAKPLTCTDRAFPQGAEPNTAGRERGQNEKKGGESNVAALAGGSRCPCPGGSGWEGFVSSSLDANSFKRASPASTQLNQLHQEAPLARTPPPGQSLLHSPPARQTLLHSPPAGQSFLPPHTSSLSPLVPLSSQGQAPSENLKCTTQSPRGSSQSPSYQPELRDPTPIAEYSSMGGSQHPLQTHTYTREHQDANPLDSVVETRVKEQGAPLSHHPMHGVAAPPPARPVPPPPPHRRDPPHKVRAFLERSNHNDFNCALGSYTAWLEASLQAAVQMHFCNCTRQPPCSFPLPISLLCSCFLKGIFLHSGRFVAEFG